jgi:repressor LexA
MRTKDINEDTITPLRSFYRRNKRLPTYSELCLIFGYSSKNAAFRLAQRMIDEGYMEKDTAGRLLPRADKFGIPLTGYVQAGFPTPAEEDLVDSMSLDDYLIDKPETSFLLKVSGDSMIEAGILEGDLVVVERGASPKSGDIVLACVDDEWTLKYLRRQDGEYELVPANPKYPVIRAKGELKVAGVVRSSIRRY